MTDPEATVVGRWLAAGDAGDLDAFDDLLHPDALIHAPAGLSTTSAEEEKAVWRDALAAVAELRHAGQRGDVEDRRIVYRLELGPRESWALRLDMLASIDGDSVTPRTAERRFGVIVDEERQDEIDQRLGKEVDALLAEIDRDASDQPRFRVQPVTFLRCAT